MAGTRPKTRNGAAELRRRAKKQIESLSSERLRVAADFLSYLEERESNEATDELLRIPGFAEQFEEAQRDMAAGRMVNWRKVRRDV